MPNNQELNVQEYVAQSVTGIRAEIAPISAQVKDLTSEFREHRNETNKTLSTLATKAELKEAIEAGNKKYRGLQGMFWTACTVCGTAISIMGKFIWDLVPHVVPPKINTP